MKTILYLTRNGLMEPLGRSQVLPYLVNLSTTYKIIVISSEKKEDLKIFDKHPEHQKLVKKIIPKLDSGHAMDFIPIDA